MTFVVTWRHTRDGRRTPVASQFAAVSEDDAREMCASIHGKIPGYQVLNICRMQ